MPWLSKEYWPVAGVHFHYPTTQRKCSIDRYPSNLNDDYGVSSVSKKRVVIGIAA